MIGLHSEINISFNRIGDADIWDRIELHGSWSQIIRMEKWTSLYF